MKQPKLGSGKRFFELESHLRAHGTKNPKATAAAIGIEKYGQAKMTKMAQAGKKKPHHFEDGE